MHYTLSITCSEAEDLLISRTCESLRIPEAALLRAHLAGCTRCREYAATLQHMQRALSIDAAMLPAPNPAVQCLLQARLLALSPAATECWLHRLSSLAWAFMKPVHGYHLAGAAALTLCLMFIADRAPLRMDPRPEKPAIAADSMESVAVPDSEADSLQHLEEVRQTVDDSILILMTGRQSI